ncbi:MAG: alpha/beta fold hydrolase, partial [Thermoplasmata archaeon]
VGCSNGGGLALELALEHPATVKALLLVATGVSGFDGSTDPDGKPDYDADGVRLKEVFKAWTAGRKDEALQRLQEYWCSMQTGQGLELVRQMMRDNADEIFTDASAQHNTPLVPPALPRLKSIRVPTTVLYGDHDEPTGGWIARRVAREIPEAQFVPVSGADHLVNLSRPDAFDTALRRLLG